jgi:hypothetical protein
MKAHHRSLALGVAVLVMAPAVASAQSGAGGAGREGEPPARLFRGLFGGAAVRDDRPQSLDLSASVFVSYIDSLTSLTTTGVVDPRAQGTATYRGGNASLTYNGQWTNFSWGASASSGLSYVPELREFGDPWIRRWTAGTRAAYSHDLGPRTLFTTRGSISYSPYFQWGDNEFMPATVAPPTNVPGLDFVVARAPSFTSTAGVVLKRQMSRRSSLEMLYEFRDRTFIGDEVDRPTLHEHAAGARYMYQLGPYVSVRAGYQYRLANYGGVNLSPRGRHELDIGLDGSYGLGKSYAIDRRTTVSFNVRPSIFLGERYFAAGAGDEQPARQESDPTLRVFLGGDASLVRTFGRTWSASASYNRSARYEDGFDRLFMSDSVSGGVSGLITERVDFSAITSYSAGNVGFTGENRGYSRMWSSASVRAAINRMLAAYVKYFYYHYKFEGGVRLPLGLPASVDRHGASAGLTLWVPLW